MKIDDAVWEGLFYLNGNLLCADENAICYFPSMEPYSITQNDLTCGEWEAVPFLSFIDACNQFQSVPFRFSENGKKMVVLSKIYANKSLVVLEADFVSGEEKSRHINADDVKGFWFTKELWEEMENVNKKG
jgi:hypothetical protein